MHFAEKREREICCNRKKQTIAEEEVATGQKSRKNCAKKERED